MAKMMVESVEKWGAEHTCPLHVYIMEKQVGSCKQTHSSERLIHISASFDFCMCRNSSRFLFISRRLTHEERGLPSSTDDPSRATCCKLGWELGSAYVT